MPKTQLERRVLADPRLSIYECGRNDIRTGQIDERILAAMEYLADNGFRLTITSLKCGHSFLTTSGNVSEHSTGDAMDIAAGQRHPDHGQPGPGLDHRGGDQDPAAAPGHDGAAPDHLAHDLGGPTFAMADHADHIHVGYYPRGQAGKDGQAVRVAAEAGPVGAADRADRRDPQPDGPHATLAASRSRHGKDKQESKRRARPRGRLALTGTTRRGS